MHYPEAEENKEKPENENSSATSTEDNTSSFYQEGQAEDSNQSNETEETTSSFYNEDEQSTAEEDSSDSFYQGEDEGADQESSQKEILPGPDKNKKLSEYQFIKLMNNAFTRAEKMDLNADQMLQLLKEEMNYQAAAYYEIPNDLEKYNADSKKNLQNLILKTF